MPPLRAILFDYVHTLADSGDTGALRWHFFSQALRRLVQALPSRRRQDLPFTFFSVVGYVSRGYNGSYGHGEHAEADLRALFAEGFRQHGLPLEDSLIDEITALNHSAYAERVVVPDSTRQTLERLRQQGLRLGVVSNNMFQRRWMGDFPLLFSGDGLLDAVVLSSDVGVRKPSERIYRAALNQLGVGAAETIFVGDRLVEDVRAPKALGMPRAFLTYEFRREPDPQVEADGILRRLPDLLELL